MKTTRAQRIIQISVYMLMDAVAISLSYLMAAFMFRVIQMDVSFDLLVVWLPIVLVFKLIFFHFTGMYRMLINHVGFEDVIKIVIVSIISNIMIVIFIALSGILFMYKSAFLFITPVEIGLLALPRLANRIITFIKTNIDWNKALGRRTMIVGAGSAGEIVVKEIYRNKDLNNIPVAFLDDDEHKIGKRLSGIRILGPISEISTMIDELKIEDVIIAISELPLTRLREIFQKVNEKNVRIKRLISMSDVTDGQKTKIIDVKIEDLLNRDEITLEDESIKDFIKDEIVLVTGGGGSIGSELCRQISELKPKQLIIFDIYENNAYDIQMELLRKFSKRNDALDLVVRIGSVYNKQRLESIFKEFHPTIVFHAAAYKHVPLMEDSAVEAVRTNVIGTYNAAALSKTYGVKKFVLVSSDKAVRPTNIMGATKRYAELIIQQQQNHQSETKFAAVRFGNVLGSNGSVIPLFKKQIEDGGPITVTHKDITRYFMTIPEAVGLILQCGVYAEGGEVFILDMGEPVKIYELAEKMISLAGLRPHEDIRIEVVGLRPGEKLYEELLVNHEDKDQLRTQNEKIYVEKQRDVNDYELKLEEMSVAVEGSDNEQIKYSVGTIIETYCRETK